jgi:hypothetical protein
MIAIVLRCHRAISWKLGRSHGTRRRPYSRPWWADEGHYALAYTYAKLIEIPPEQGAPIGVGITSHCWAVFSKSFK